MKTIVNIISRFAALLSRRFRKAEAVRIINEHEQMLNIIRKADDAIYKSIVTQLKNDPNIPSYGAEVRLLRRRLLQYERLRTHGSLADQDKALRKLEKQWKKVENISNRKSKDNSYDRRAKVVGPS